MVFFLVSNKKTNRERKGEYPAGILTFYIRGSQISIHNSFERNANRYRLSGAGRSMDRAAPKSKIIVEAASTRLAIARKMITPPRPIRGKRSSKDPRRGHIAVFWAYFDDPRTDEEVLAMSDGPPANAPPPTPTGKRKWWKWPLRFVILALGIFFFRQTILIGFAGLLVVDEPVQAADYLLVLDGDRSEEKAAELYHQGLISQVVIFEFAPRRLERMGIIPTHGPFVVSELAKRQVPQSAIIVVPAQAKSRWDLTRSLDDWLASKPKGTRVLICCDRLDSRRLASVLDQVLRVEHRENVRILALTHRYFDETNWWQRKEGVISVFHRTFRLGYVTFIGEDKSSWREWEPDEYEAFLKSAGQPDETLP
jgi:hypothetical protein